LKTEFCSFLLQIRRKSEIQFVLKIHGGNVVLFLLLIRSAEAEIATELPDDIFDAFEPPKQPKPNINSRIT
jgi:hypothetical protein